MAGIELIRSFLQQAHAQGSRSTALNPLGWLSAILVAAVATAFKEHAPTWAEIALVCLLALVSLCYLAAYAYFAMNDVDALRSERYTLSKMMIESSQIGDDRQGFAKPNEGLQLPKTGQILPAPRITSEQNAG